VVNFNKLNPARLQAKPTDPLRIFQRLPQPSHIDVGIPTLIYEADAGDQPAEFLNTTAIL